MKARNPKTSSKSLRTQSFQTKHTNQLCEQILGNAGASSIRFYSLHRILSRCLHGLVMMTGVSTCSLGWGCPAPGPRFLQLHESSSPAGRSQAKGPRRQPRSTFILFACKQSLWLLLSMVSGSLFRTSLWITHEY